MDDDVFVCTQHIFNRLNEVKNPLLYYRCNVIRDCLDDMFLFVGIELAIVSSAPTLPQTIVFCPKCRLHELHPTNHILANIALHCASGSLTARNTFIIELKYLQLSTDIEQKHNL